MTKTLSPKDVQHWLTAGGELAFIDVREAGQYGEGHPLFAVSLPYSRLELDAPRLLPCLLSPIVVLDAGDGVAAKACRRLSSLGYTNLAIVEGGMPGWAESGLVVYQGVNVPSKVFGELVEHQWHTPSITAPALMERQQAGEAMVILDGRTPAEYQRMNIPGGICCPNGELAHRFEALVPDETTTVVVNCAGRTRSIIGAENLIEMGFPNPIIALENGTQGWTLAGFELERGAQRMAPSALSDACLDGSRQRGRELIQRAALRTVDNVELKAMREAVDQALYLLDVRTAEEFAAGHLPGSEHAPGGQLVQGTDQWIAVRGARVVLVDDTSLRAAMAAHWLRQMGHDVYVLLEDVAAHPDRETVAESIEFPTTLPECSAGDVAGWMNNSQVAIVDLRPSEDYRAAHLAGAEWCIRPRLDEKLAEGERVVLVGDRTLAELAKVDLDELGCRHVHWLAASQEQWQEAGLTVSASTTPTAKEALDFLFFVHDRHLGNLDSSREYLRWETQLIAQLSPVERDMFAVWPR